MKVIDFPDAVTIGNETIDLPKICEKFIFNQGFWRDRSNIGFALSLYDKLQNKKPLSDGEHEALEKGMKLEGQMISPELNRYFLECLQAVYLAKNEESK